MPDHFGYLAQGVWAGSDAMVNFRSRYYAAGFATNWGKGTHTDGHQRGNAWVGEILPRALKYAAAIGCK